MANRRSKDGSASLFVDPALHWIVVRMLARGRYVQLGDARRAGDWDMLRSSLQRMCATSGWWCPPWSGHAADVAAPNSRRPLLQGVGSLVQACALCVSRSVVWSSRACPPTRSVDPDVLPTLRSYWAASTSSSILTVPENAAPVPATAATVPASARSSAKLDAAGRSVSGCTEAIPKVLPKAQAKKRRRAKAGTDRKGGAPCPSSSTRSC